MDSDCQRCAYLSLRRFRIHHVSNMVDSPLTISTLLRTAIFIWGGFLGGMTATVAGRICNWTARAFSRVNGGMFEAEFRILSTFLG
jgi:hypothetical protein